MAPDGKCLKCGTPLAANMACATCGGTARTFEEELTAQVTTTGSVTKAVELKLDAAVATSSASVKLSVESPNAAMARRLALEAAVADVEEAVRVRNNHDAQLATKRALEALHELQDCLKRSEWSQASWDAKAIELWRAHMGARNVAHHTSTGIVSMHSDPPGDQSLTWSIKESALTGLRYKDQATAYRNELDGQPVLPGLRELLHRIQVAVK
jgi:uncharacterized Zn finger protein (UPF0148 family)